MSIWWRLSGKMSLITIMHEKETPMIDTDMIKQLVPQNAVPEASRLAYTAGYYESTILSLMARFPEVRKDIEERISFRIVSI